MLEIDDAKTARSLIGCHDDDLAKDGVVHGCLKDPVEQSGGALRIESRAGEGARASIAPPRVGGPAPALADDDVEPAPCRGSESVLVVEDDEFVRRYAVRCLEDLGYEVVAAENGAAALEQLEGPGRFDVVFSDVLMPGCLSGYELAAHVWEEHGSAVAILLASGCLASEREEIEAGKFEFLSKPYTCKQLGRRLRAALDQRRCS